MNLRQVFAVTVAMVMFTCVTVLAQEARLMRFPDIHNNQIVFSHGGDLWIVSSNGGDARRLTTDEGLELFGRFSPDGSQIAFTGQYDGDQNVFVMPTIGGEPKRLSFHPAIRESAERMGPESIVMDWTPDGAYICYRSRQATHSIWEGQLMLVSPDGGFPQPLPIPRGGFMSFSTDGNRIAYCPIFRDFRTWKRYKGGMAQDVWIYDFVNEKSTQITNWEGTDNVPMWDHASGKIYFNSDRTGTLNLFVYDPQTQSTTQVTNFTEYDVRWPSIGPGAIVFENGGYLYVMDLPDGEPRKISVRIRSDHAATRSGYVNASKMIRDYTLSPDAKRALFTARGEVFTVPAEKGNTRNLTNTPGAHEKYATWSPDGTKVAYVSDLSGEDEIYLIDMTGKDRTPKRLTSDGSAYRYHLVWSPDSKKLVWSDKNTDVYYIDVGTKRQVHVTTGERNDIRDYTWSPDSRFISYSSNNKHNITQVWVYSLDDNVNRPVTSGDFDDYSPSFDPTGQYLYYLTNRAFNPILGDYEFNFILNKMTEVQLIVLQADSTSPLAPQSDEAVPQTSGDKESDDKDKDKSADGKASTNVHIDFGGIYERTVKLPIEPGNLGGLRAVEGRVFYVSYPLGGLDGTVEDAKATAHVFDLKDRKDHVWLEDFGGGELTPDGKKAILHKGSNYEIVDATGESAKTGETVLDLSHMDMWLNPRAEWRQIFNECWRIERDFFYDTNYHGIDWDAMKRRYEPLLDHVDHRFDLTYVIGEMIGELATGHTYIGGGEFPKPESDKVGLLGIDWAIDSSAGRFTIGRILEGQNWRDDRRSPLTEPGVKAAAGDYVIAIDGEDLRSNDNPYRMLVHTVGEIVTLTLSKTSDGRDSWTTEVRPIATEVGLRYNDFVVEKTHYTDSISEGRIGYVHIPNMGAEGLKQFTSTYYKQIRKDGLVIDVRWNGGGFVSQLIIERLRRVLSGMGMSRNFDTYTYPAAVFNGYLACLINEHSCSDGDIFPYHFREYDLGPVIGKRTWGGVVGIRGRRPLLDGGYVYAPEFAKYDLERHWVLENYGVEPDIDVGYPPEIVQKGGDPQIDRAVAELMKEIETNPRTIPEPPDTRPDER